MDQDDSKKMMALHANTLRGITEGANSHNIRKEDIVQVLHNENGFVLLYYK